MKFCPRCGHELGQRMVAERLRPACANCGYVAFLNPGLAVGVVATDERGRVVLVRRGEEPGRGKWGLPAGYMEGDEMAEEGARRECLEETGLEVELDGLWGVWSYLHSTRLSAGVLILYRAHIIGGRLQPGGDALEARMFEPEAIPYSELAFRTHDEALRRLAGLL